MTERLDFDKDAITPAEALVYDRFLDASVLTGHVASGILRVSKSCGLPRARVLEVIRKLNPDFTTTRTP